MELKKEHILITIAAGIVLSLIMITATGLFAGSHTLYENRTTASAILR